jgi:hypothetical protein
MLGGGAGACLLEALESGRGEEGCCAFIVGAGVCVDGGAILDFLAMENVEEERGLVWCFHRQLGAWSLSG